VLAAMRDIDAVGQSIQTVVIFADLSKSIHQCELGEGGDGSVFGPGITRHCGLVKSIESQRLAIENVSFACRGRQPEAELRTLNGIDVIASREHIHELAAQGKSSPHHVFTASKYGPPRLL
jgi:hypothetical protein